MSSMTAREQEVLAVIRENPLISQNEIAEQIGISRSAVASHIMHLTEKGAIKGRGYLFSDQPFVAVIGGANIDIHGAPAGKLQMRDSNPGTVHTSAGGVARNIAENLARLGHDCRLITALGNDRYGRTILQQGRDVGIDMQHVLQSEFSATSTYLSVLDGDGDMQVSISDMTIMAELSVARLRDHEKMLRQAPLIVFDCNLPGESIEWLCTAMSGNVLFADTVSATKACRIKPFLSSLHTLKCSLIEAQALSGLKGKTQKQLDAIANWFHQRGVTRLFVTLGANGVFYSNAEARGIEEPAKQHRSISNANGAGDAFMAGLISAWLNEAPLKRSLRTALAAADITLADPATCSSALSVDALERAMNV